MTGVTQGSKAINFATGDRIIVEGETGREVVTVVGFQVGTHDMVIDDGSGGIDALRFCDPSEIVSEVRR